MANFRCPKERTSLVALAGLATFLTIVVVFWSHTSAIINPGNHYGIDAVHENGEDRKYLHRLAGDRRISPWHDIPLRPIGAGASEDLFVFICEIPKGTRAKMEINKETPFNPIVQDTKKGKLRFYHSDSLVNYGAFPQTWEDPAHADILVPKYEGDNGVSNTEHDATKSMQPIVCADPTDVIDVSDRMTNSGDIYVVKVVGALGMVDGGELDWKIVVIDMADPLADEVDDVADLADSHPLSKKLVEVRNWFRDYKLPDGKPENEFANGGKYYSKSDALTVVKEQHELWARLVRSAPPADAKLWWEHQPNAS